MTNEEKQEIIAAVLSAIRTNSLTINQLTPVAQMSDDDIIELDGGRSTTYAVLMSALEAYATQEYVGNALEHFAQLAANGAVWWQHSPLVFLSTMGETLDNVDGELPSYTLKEGDLYYWEHSGYQIFEQGDDVGTYVGYSAKTGVYYWNLRTMHLYRWTGSAMEDVADCGFNAIDTETGDLEFADSEGNIIMRLVDGHIVTQNFDSSDINPDVDLSNYYNKSQADAKFAAKTEVYNKSESYNKSEVDALIQGIEPVTPVTPPENLKILFLGNSFTTGTFSYLPFMLKNYGINITIHILYEGGAGINTYNSGWTSANKTMYSINTETDTEWTTTNNQAASAVVASKEWDMIVLQQGSSDSYTWSNYSNLASLISKVKNAATNPAVKIGWVINHLGTSKFVNGTDNRPNVLVCAKKAVDDNSIDFVFPYGTAIFNLQDKYPTLGDGTYMTYDTLHLQEGFPSYCGASANLQALFEGFYPGLSIADDIFIPDTTHRNNASGHVKGDIIGMDGLSITTEKWAMASRIAHFAALSANRDKFTINKII